MSRFPRLRRRPDQWANAHERAIARAAERLDGPLGLAESTWLDEHLAGCGSCAGLAAAYEADRQALRALREHQPEPPRDLWARTAAAIEVLSTESGVPEAVRQPAPRRRRLGGLPLSAMSAVAVVAVVVGATLLSNGIGGLGLNRDTGVAAPSAVGTNGPPDIASGAEPTPFAVGADDVAWIDTGPKGYAYSRVPVDEVCPAEGASGCPALRDQGETVVGFDNAPRTIIGSPTTRQAVAISKLAATGDEVVVVDLPDRAAAESPSPTPTGSVEPSAAASSDPSTQAPGETATPSNEPSPTVTVQTSPSPEPLQTPEATRAARIAIARGIEVVGESAAYSSSGAWFAFTARPGEGEGGPDVFVWRVGDQEARRLTNDGASYFASWSGDRVVVSRPSDASATSSEPASALIDPETGVERVVGDLWRPMVDPSGRFAIAWEGKLEREDDRSSWRPASGRLVLRTWSDDGGPSATDGSDDHRVVAENARADYDVRWDDTGEWVAVWVGDENDAATGRLTLYHLDADRERLEKVEGAPIEVRALPGFSIGAGRLAWATPRGQSGEGSRVQIAAWSGSGIGIVESSPGEDVRIVR
jgi:putative zinc finger protein